MEPNKRFFKEDIKVARGYNRKSVAPGMEDTLGDQILHEWAVSKMNQIKKKFDLNNFFLRKSLV